MTFYAERLLRAVRAWFYRYGGERWSRGAVAKRVDGTACHPLDQAAYAYSLVGALDRALWEFGWLSSFVTGALARTYVLEAVELLAVGRGARDPGEAPIIVDLYAAKLTVDELVGFVDGAIARGLAARAARGGPFAPDREAILDGVAAALKRATGGGKGHAA